ncbi:MAG: porin family protein [Bacteroidota bacterium]|jgi:hypothetical protein
MKEDLSFEEIIKEKISVTRLHPSDKVWDSIQVELARSFHPRLNYILLLPLIILFSFPPLPITNRTLLIDLNIHTRKVNVPNSGSHIDNNPNALYTTKRSQRKIANDESTLSPVLLEARPVLNAFSNVYVNHIHPPIEIDALRKKMGGVNFAPHEKGFDLTEKVGPSSVSAKLHEQSLAHKNEMAPENIFSAVQIYVTPSVNYRRAKVHNLPSSNTDIPSDSSSLFIPSSAIEAGLALRKPINERWALKSGVQVNISSYERKNSNNNELITPIKSVKDNSPAEEDITQSNTLKGKRNVNQNFRFSIPIELEYKLGGNKEISFYISTSLQPSFSVYSNSNLITSEFKDQIPVDPYLYRRFNVLTGIECFFRLNAGSFDIQAGPQFRYQLLSNNIGASPYREHLMDYGIKIGVIKNIF